MSPTNPEKRKQHKRLKRLQADLEALALPDGTSHRSDRPRGEQQRQALVERLIQEAMAEGAFDHLPGKGKPLDLSRNPHLESGQELAYNLLKNNGFAPEWIERDKEIRQEIEAVRNQLRSAWQQRATESTWQMAKTRFEERLNKINRKIEDFNLITPIVSCQRSKLRLADEIGRVQQEGNP